MFFPGTTCQLDVGLQKDLRRERGLVLLNCGTCHALVGICSPAWSRSTPSIPHPQIPATPGVSRHLDRHVLAHLRAITGQKRRCLPALGSAQDSLSSRPYFGCHFLQKATPDCSDWPLMLTVCSHGLLPLFVTQHVDRTCPSAARMLPTGSGLVCLIRPRP